MTSSRAIHRAELPVVASGPGERALVVAGGIAALAVGVAITVALGRAGIGSIRAIAILPFAPLALYVAMLRRWHDRRLAFATSPTPVEASRGQLVAGGRAMRAASAICDRGVLRVHGPLGISQVAILVTPGEARAIVDALEVPDEGVRSISVWGPIASIPVLGVVTMSVAPALAVFSLTVLAFAGHITVRATLAFAAILIATTAISILALARRRLHVADDRVELRWLGRARSIPAVSLESMALERGAIVIRARGARPLRLALVPVGAGPSFSLEDARASAESRATEVIALASGRHVASVFE